MSGLPSWYGEPPGQVPAESVEALIEQMDKIDPSRDQWHWMGNPRHPDGDLIYPLTWEGERPVDRFGMSHEDWFRVNAKRWLEENA